MLPSAVCDVLAGFALAGGTLRMLSLSTLLAALGSLALYGMGMVLNDLAGIQEDRALGRNKPLVSGIVTPLDAFLLGWGLLFMGILCIYLAGIPFLLPILLTLGIVLYDFGSTGLIPPAPFWIQGSPFALGLCRGLNLSLGYFLLNQNWSDWPIPLSVLITYAIYTTMVGFHGRLEDSKRNPRALSKGFAVVALMLLLLPLAFFSFPWAGLFLLPSLFFSQYAKDPTSRSGILLKGFSRYDFILALGMGAFGLAGLCAIPAWILPLFQKRQWT